MIDLSLWQIVLLTAISLATGLLGGFVGLALGTMRLPALLLIGMSAPVAAGTNIMVSTLSAMTGLGGHLREGRVNRRLVLVMGPPSMIGALIGGIFGGRVPESLLITAAGFFVTWQGIELAVRALRDRPPTPAAPSDDAAPSPGRDLGGESDVAASAPAYAIEAGIGAAVGLLGGAVGLILGSIRLPALIRFLRVDPAVAAGSNMAIGFLMGLSGWIGHAAQANVDYQLLASMGIAGMIGSYYGARFTGRVSLFALVLTMGVVLTAVGIVLLTEAYRRSSL